jgi:hypothetical protein
MIKEDANWIATVFADLDWARDKDDRRRITG